MRVDRGVGAGGAGRLLSNNTTITVKNMAYEEIKE
jgi:hypothetical protein